MGDLTQSPTVQPYDEERISDPSKSGASTVTEEVIALVEETALVSGLMPVASFWSSTASRPGR